MLLSTLTADSMCGVPVLSLASDNFDQHFVQLIMSNVLALVHDELHEFSALKFSHV